MFMTNILKQKALSFNLFIVRVLYFRFPKESVVQQQQLDRTTVFEELHRTNAVGIHRFTFNMWYSPKG